jgi:hypothetical protein
MALPQTMQSIRLHTPVVNGLRREAIDTPSLRHGEALVEVHAAAITRDQLEWPLARAWLTELPAVVPALPGAPVRLARRHGARVGGPRRRAGVRARRLVD